MRVAIVGAGGQVGSALLRYFANAAGIHAVGICRSRVSAARLLLEGREVRVGSVTQESSARTLLSDADVIINCALPQGGPAQTAKENRALENGLCAGAAGRTLIHLSSVAVYGSPIVAQRVNFCKPRPTSRYGREKLCSERHLLRLARRFSVKCSIVRLGHVYGPGLHWSRALCDLVAEPDFMLPFHGAKPSNAVYIDNVARALGQIMAGATDPGVYNLFDCPQTTWLDLLNMHSEAIGRNQVPMLSEEQNRDLARYCALLGGRSLLLQLAFETARWLRSLPASFVQGVPSLKELGELIMGRVRSERLEQRLKRWYWRATCSNEHALPSSDHVLWALISDAAPGPCLSYEAVPRTACLLALREWWESLFEPYGRVC